MASLQFVTIDRGYNVLYITLGCAKNGLIQIMRASFSLWFLKGFRSRVGRCLQCSTPVHSWLQQPEESIITLEIAEGASEGVKLPMCGCVPSRCGWEATSSFLKLPRLFRQIKKMKLSALLQTF